MDNAEMNADSPNVVTDRLIALGKVIEWSASMEQILRDAFCSLVGSKFAAIVVGGQSASWLIEQCKALTDAHQEMPPEQREAIKAALQRCAAANELRNHLVHGVKTASRIPDGALQTLRSRNRTYARAVLSWTTASIGQAAGELLNAGLALFGAVQHAVTPEMMVIGDALGWENRRREQAAGP